MDTRTSILEKNFEAIRMNGFQGTRTDKVIAELGITKGAFYHYFADKLSLGYAVVDEILYPMYVSNWQHLDTYEGHPIDAIAQSITRLKNVCNDQTVGYGCPLNNLIQEMSPLDSVFQKKLHRVVEQQITLISSALIKGIKEEKIKDCNPEVMAFYILASIEGSFSIAKSVRSIDMLHASFDQLIAFLNTLKV